MGKRRKTFMRRKSSLTPKFRQNWWIDAILGMSAVIAVLSSLYFLAYLVGGYQGGRNPYYNIRVIFDRHTWDMLHTWTGVLMIMAALLHIVIYWPWIAGTTNRTWQVITGERQLFGPRLTYKIILDALKGSSFPFNERSNSHFDFDSKTIKRLIILILKLALSLMY
jgi:hypothetical protein